MKPGARVHVQGVPDEDFAAELRNRDTEAVDGEADVVFLGVAESAELAVLPAMWRRVATGGALWVVYPKGVRVVTEHDVRGAGLAEGIVDNKVVRFSDTHTAFRFVARRNPARR